MSLSEMRVCAYCGNEFPAEDFILGGKKCKKCSAEDRANRRCYTKDNKPKNNGKYKLTELDKIAIKCQELGISYGEYQQRERQGRL